MQKQFNHSPQIIRGCADFNAQEITDVVKSVYAYVAENPGKYNASKGSQRLKSPLDPLKNSNKEEDDDETPMNKPFGSEYRPFSTLFDTIFGLLDAGLKYVFNKRQ